MNPEADKRRRKVLVHRDGVTRFTRETERKVFFVLTVGMLLWGLLTKLGIL